MDGNYPQILPFSIISSLLAPLIGYCSSCKSTNVDHPTAYSLPYTISFVAVVRMIIQTHLGIPRNRISSSANQATYVRHLCHFPKFALGVGGPLFHTIHHASARQCNFRFRSLEKGPKKNIGAKITQEEHDRWPMLTRCKSETFTVQLPHKSSAENLS